jgi:hypothetical protein
MAVNAHHKKLIKEGIKSMSFENLRQIAGRLDLLLQREYDCLNSFWNESQFCFSTNDPFYDRVNVTSTCCCLFAILEDDKLKADFSKGHKSVSGEEPLKKIVDVLLKAEWKSENLDLYNIYTTPIVITALNRLKGDFSHKKIGEGLDAILKNVKAEGTASVEGAASFGDYSPSGFLTYWSAKALERIDSHKELSTAFQSRCSDARRQITIWAESEVYRQLAFYSAEDSAAFDVLQLAYALVIYVEGYQRIEQKVNEKIVTKAIEVIFSSQLPDGLWPKSHPIFHYGTRGNVYTFSFEMLDALLTLGDVFPHLFKPYVEKLEVSLRWAEQNQLEREVTCGTDNRRLIGWRSNHLLIQNGPEAWSTAAVLSASRRLESLVRHYLNDDILTEFGAKRFSTGTRSDFDRMYDCVLKFHQNEINLKPILEKHLIAPHLPDASSADANRRYSAVFFGPPGTAKTSLAEAIARALGWPFMHLQTSDFLSEGFSRITGRARYIFERLNMLEKVVILFDEVEEFVLKRSGDERPPPESRMITTSMLTLIQELRRRKKVIFIVATNHLEEIDPAITRRGRFDMILLISPPSLLEKQRHFRDRIVDVTDENTSFISKFEEFTQENFIDSIEFFTYGEWDAFISDVIQEFGSKADSDWSESEISHTLNAVLEKHRESITIRDDLKKDYLCIKNKNMSRLS